jgi:CHAT domain-containing protein
MPDLVFLAACFASNAMDKFYEAGAKHVIGTTKNINDGLSQVFTEAFYTQLFQKGSTVCEAFVHA